MAEDETLSEFAASLFTALAAGLKGLSILEPFEQEYRAVMAVVREKPLGALFALGPYFLPPARTGHALEAGSLLGPLLSLSCFPLDVSMPQRVFPTFQAPDVQGGTDSMRLSLQVIQVMGSIVLTSARQCIAQPPSHKNQTRGAGRHGRDANVAASHPRTRRSASNIPPNEPNPAFWYSRLHPSVFCIIPHPLPSNIFCRAPSRPPNGILIHPLPSGIRLRAPEVTPTPSPPVSSSTPVSSPPFGIRLRAPSSPSRPNCSRTPMPRNLSSSSSLPRERHLAFTCVSQ